MFMAPVDEKPANQQENGNADAAIADDILLVLFEKCYSQPDFLGELVGLQLFTRNFSHGNLR
jgi:hypothetical protein